ncbi:hypothetical protein CBL_07932 [Carabus blaptoides fortunei]
MEDTHNLLAVVLKQHYHGRTEVILTAREIIKDYINTSTPNYEKTLSALYNLMNDLPSDILLYFLTTVPLPSQADGISSHLISLMKQMMGSTFQNKVKPTLVRYLHGSPPPLLPISTADNNIPDSLPKVSSTSNDNEETVSSALVEHVKSVIDENIQQNKMGKKRKIRSRNTYKNSQKKSIGVVRPLAFICSENIYKNHLYYKSFYNKKKCDAWNLLHDDKIGKKNELQCYEALRDVNKKLEWLRMFATGKVPLKLIEEAYKDRDILYLARQRGCPPAIPDNILEITPELSNSIDTFLNKC